jgi:hypothetical protein
LDGFLFFGQLVVVYGFLVACDVIANVIGTFAVILLFRLFLHGIAVYIF